MFEKDFFLCVKHVELKIHVIKGANLQQTIIFSIIIIIINN